MNKKLSGQERKAEILSAAQTVFLRKGFGRATMEDVIEETTLSKGGVYYHYKSTREMILDMFMQGNDYRINQIKRYLEENNLNMEDLKDENILAELITQKVLDINPLTVIYAQFLVEAMYDTELRKVYRKLIDQSKAALTDAASMDISRIYKDSAKERAEAEFEFITNFINTFILGSNILKVNDNFKKHRMLIKEMSKIAICYFRKGVFPAEQKDKPSYLDID